MNVKSGSLEGSDNLILKNIRRLCQRDNITLAELERKTGLGNGLVAKWATSNPRVDLLKKVADFFGVTVDDLLREDKDDE